MIPDYVLDWARMPGPVKVLRVIRDRHENGRLGVRARIDVALTSSERAEVGQFLEAGWASSGGLLVVQRLREGLAANGVALEELLESFGGPLVDRRAERAAARDARAASRAERAATVERVVDAAEGAPVEHLAVLAARLFADSHALDRSTPLGRAVARRLAERSATDERPYVDPVLDAGAWRDAWASVGVLCDGVSTQVLVLNLPLVGDATAARLAAIAGEPVWLTLRSLAGSVALAEGVDEVFVCENPAIVEAAADRFGAGSKPLVCTYGFPNQATMTLLAALARSATLRVRADGDVAGWRIVAQVEQLPGARRWRMPEGFARYEEEILDDLLADLAEVRS